MTNSKAVSFHLLFNYCICLLQVIGVTLPYDKVEDIRNRMTEIAPNLTQYDEVEDANYFTQAQELSKVKYIDG